ncbi:MAG: oxidoreductase [Dehalococcoidia bacterium]|nr:MAG: oxidoreductase [Dehalococcoidia bacterium]
MRAWRLHAVGSIDNLRLDEVAEPACGPDDVLIRVRAIGLNSSELQLINGEWEGYHHGRTLPMAPGIEAAGEVIAVGERVADRAVGDRVTVHYWWSCGVCDQCLDGWENTCLQRRQFGRTVDGAYQEVARVPAQFAIPLADPVSFEAAAALSTAAATAWHMLIRHAALRAGEWVLITGASSGIGVAGVQVARLAGARVIGTAGSPEKLRRLRELGVQHVIDHREEPDFTRHVLAITGGRGVDVVYDVPGAATIPPALLTLRPRGRLVLGGYMSGKTASLDLIAGIAKEWRIYGSATWTRPELRHILDLTAQGALTPVIDSVFPFEALPEGLRKMERRDVVGKIVVTA